MNDNPAVPFWFEVKTDQVSTGAGFNAQPSRLALIAAVVVVAVAFFWTTRK
jgi:hypothetical protein